MEGVSETMSGGAAVAPGCRNCGAALVGRFCHQCGQKGHIHRTIGAFWHDLLHGVLHFEGKIWRTLPMLAWRPGELTRRYIEGERAKFVSPLALFLFSVFIMFASFSAIGGRAYYVDAPQQQRAEATQTDVAEMDLSDAPEPFRSFDAAYKRAKQNPTLLFYRLQTNAYKFSWALIPMMVPFVGLLFLHRRRYRKYKLYDHTVFVTYSLAFLSLFAITYTLLKLMGMNGPIALLPFAIPLLHTYRQLRGSYGLSPLGAIWRTMALTIFLLVVSAMFFAILLVQGVLG